MYTLPQSLVVSIVIKSEFVTPIIGLNIQFCAIQIASTAKLLNQTECINL